MPMVASLGLVDEHQEFHHHILMPTGPILALSSLLLLIVRSETEK